MRNEVRVGLIALAVGAVAFDRVYHSNDAELTSASGSHMTIASMELREERLAHLRAEGIRACMSLGPIVEDRVILEETGLAGREAYIAMKRDNISSGDMLENELVTARILAACLEERGSPVDLVLAEQIRREQVLN